MQGIVAQTVPSDLLQRYEALLEVGDIIHSCRDLEELFRNLAHLLRRVVQFDGVAVGLLTEDKSALRLTLLETLTPAPIQIGFTVPLGLGPPGVAFREQRSVRFSVHEHKSLFPFH